MPSQADIQNTILNASYKIAQLTLVNYNLIQSGGLAVREDFINYFSLNLAGMTYQYNNALYISPTSVTIYNRLNYMIGIPQDATVDPNFVNPTTTIIIDGSAGTIINSAKIPFVNTTSIGLYTYNISYKNIYGNNPSVSFWLDDMTQDTTTPPTITYATPGDITSEITQIVWDYALPVSGYIQISGSPSDI